MAAHEVQRAIFATSMPCPRLRVRCTPLPLEKESWTCPWMGVQERGSAGGLHQHSRMCVSVCACMCVCVCVCVCGSARARVCACMCHGRIVDLRTQSIWFCSCSDRWCTSPCLPAILPGCDLLLAFLPLGHSHAPSVWKSAWGADGAPLVAPWAPKKVVCQPAGPARSGGPTLKR